MKLFDIALKDMLRSFRSTLLVFMFGIPLLMTGMFVIMFGNLKSGDNEVFQLPVTRVVLANLDTGSQAMSSGLAASLPAGMQARSLGEVVVLALQSPGLAQSMQVSIVPDAAAARAAVDSQQAGVAIIIPPDFSTEYIKPDGEAVLQLYQDASLSLGPEVVKAIAGQLADRLSSFPITIRLMNEQAGASGSNEPAQVSKIYLAASQSFLTASQTGTAVLFDTQTPIRSAQPDPVQAKNNLLVTIIGPIMGGMMVFFAFFTGTVTAQSILKEEEEGTLPRLFTTPTSASTILKGKFLAVGLSVLVQVTVLLEVSALVFGIPWGRFGIVALTALGIVCAATGFGICFASMLKTVRQASVITGGLLTMTGMLGMMPVFISNIPGSSSSLELVSRLVPQGWAVHGLLLGIQSGALSEVLLNLLALLAWSLVFMLIGIWRFQKRYSN